MKRFKKFLSLCLAFTLIFTAVPITTFAEEGSFAVEEEKESEFAANETDVLEETEGSSFDSEETDIEQTEVEDTEVEDTEVEEAEVEETEVEIPVSEATADSEPETIEELISIDDLLIDRSGLDSNEYCSASGDTLRDQYVKEHGIEQKESTDKDFVANQKSDADADDSMHSYEDTDIEVSKQTLLKEAELDKQSDDNAYLSINGTLITDFSQNQYGTGWIWDAEDHILILSNYNGGGIVTNLNLLYIEAYQNNTVKGSIENLSGTILFDNYGSTKINERVCSFEFSLFNNQKNSKFVVDGKINKISVDTVITNFYLYNGTVNINTKDNGNGGTYYGSGDEFYAPCAMASIETHINAYENAVLTVKGAKCTNSYVAGYDNDGNYGFIRGGAGIVSDYFEIYTKGNASVTITGGDRSNGKYTVSDNGHYATYNVNLGGHAVISNETDIYGIKGKVTMTGGKGSTEGGNGINPFGGSRTDLDIFEGVKLSMNGGGNGAGWANETDYSVNWSLTENISADESKATFTPKEYTITLNGNGGKSGGKTSITKKGIFPEKIYLDEYDFSKNNYYLIGWNANVDENYFTTADYVLFGMSTNEITDVNIALSAEYTSFGPEDVLLISYNNRQQIVTRETVGEQFTMPGDLNTIAWTDANVATEYAYGMMQTNQLYFPDEVVEFNEKTVLFETESESEINAIYLLNGNGGVNDFGGTRIVYSNAFFYDETEQEYRTYLDTLRFYDDGSSIIYGTETATLFDSAKSNGFHRNGYTFAGWEETAAGTGDGIPYSDKHEDDGYELVHFIKLDDTLMPIPVDYASPETFIQLYAQWEPHPIIAAIEDARENINSVTVSKDGKDVLTEDEWVTSKAYTSFNQVIAAAEKAVNDGADNTVLDSKLTALQTAETTFNNSKAFGSVIRAVEIELNSEFEYLAKKASLSLTVTQKSEAGTASTEKIIWSTSDPKIATVKDGKVTGVGVGTCTITATTANSGIEAECDIQVYQNATGLSVSYNDKKTTTLKLGVGCNPATIKIALTPADADRYDISATAYDTNYLNVVPIDDTTFTVSATALSAKDLKLSFTDSISGKTTTVTVKTGTPADAVTTTLKSDLVTIVKGKTATLNAKAVIDGSKTKPIDESVVWITDDPDIATVKDGKVTGTGIGFCTITAVPAQGTGSHEFEITVTPDLKSFSLKKDNKPLSTLTAVAEETEIDLDDFKFFEWKDGNHYDEFEAVEYTSSNPTIAAIDGSTLSALTVGSVKVTAKSVSTGKTASLTVKVGLKADTVTTTAKTLKVSLLKGKTTTLNAKAAIEGSKIVPIDTSVQWESDDEDIATVDQKGKVTAKQEWGRCTITARPTLGNGALSFQLTVAPEIKSFSLKAAGKTLSSTSMVVDDEDLNLRQYVVFEWKDKEAHTEFEDLTYASSNEAIASVSASGIVTAHAAGSVKITVTSESTLKTASVTIKVGQHANTVTTTAKSKYVSLNVGKTTTLNAKAALIGTTIAPINTAVFWSIEEDGESEESEAVATVDAKGKVTALNEGICTIIATPVDGTGKYEFTVSVIPPFTSFSLKKDGKSYSNPTLTVDEEVDLNSLAVFVWKDGIPRNHFENLEASSSNTNVVTVDNNGVMKAVGVGTAKVTVMAINVGKTVTISLKVVPKK